LLTAEWFIRSTVGKGVGDIVGRGVGAEYEHHEQPAETHDEQSFSDAFIHDDVGG